MVRHFGLDADPLVRHELMDPQHRPRWPSYTNQRAMDRIKVGQLPGPEMSIAKLSLTSNMPRMAEFVAGVLGPRLVADTGEWGTYAWASSCSACPACASPAGPTR